jgi:hypothetical protein
MNSTTIDVWNLDTFDEALLAKLNSERDLLRDYVLTAGGAGERSVTACRP